MSLLSADGITQSCTGFNAAWQDATRKKTTVATSTGCSVSSRPIRGWVLGTVTGGMGVVGVCVPVVERHRVRWTESSLEGG